MSGSTVGLVDAKVEKNEAKQVGEGAVPAKGQAGGAVGGKGDGGWPGPTMLRVHVRAKDSANGKESGSTRAALKLAGASQPFESLLSEDEVIDLLGLSTRKNPRSALRWLMRTERLAYYRLGKGINGFAREDIGRFLAAHRVPARGETAGQVA